MTTTSGNPKPVYVAVYDDWADWEVGHALAHINKVEWQRLPGRFTVRTLGRDLTPVTTMGGLTIVPDLAVDDLDGAAVADAALLILVGSGTWGDPEYDKYYGELAARFTEAGVPVAAICGAVWGLASAGLLDGRRHTGAAAEYLAATGYAGGAGYVEADAVTSEDGLVVTAGPTEPVAFAREVFQVLDLYTDEVLEAWVRLFGASDPSAYPVLMAAGAAESA